MDERTVCFCLWDTSEQKLLYHCLDCEKREGPRRTPWDIIWPLSPISSSNIDAPVGPSLNHTSGDTHSGAPKLASAQNNSVASKVGHGARSLVSSDKPIIHATPAQLDINTASDNSSAQNRGKRSLLYASNRFWERIGRNASHGRSCVLVSAGLIPIIGAFFHECKITAIPKNGTYEDGRTRIGRNWADRTLMLKFRREMEAGLEYQVRVSDFGGINQSASLMTASHFKHFPRDKLPSLAAAVKHLLLYLGSRRDKHYSYRFYHDSQTEGQGREAHHVQILFGMVRFPTSPDPRAATTARMVNVVIGEPVTMPTMHNGIASWHEFCDGRFRNHWEEITLSRFRYEKYRKGEHHRFIRAGPPLFLRPPALSSALYQRPRPAAAGRKRGRLMKTLTPSIARTVAPAHGPGTCCDGLSRGDFSQRGTSRGSISPGGFSNGILSNGSSVSTHGNNVAILGSVAATHGSKGSQTEEKRPPEEQHTNVPPAPPIPVGRLSEHANQTTLGLTTFPIRSAPRAKDGGPSLSAGKDQIRP